MADIRSFSHFTGPLSVDGLQAAMPPPQAFAVNGLVYGFLNERQTGEHHFQLPVHRRLWAYWCSQRPEADVPLSGKIDALAFFPALGNVLLLEPNEDGNDFRFRVYGSRVAGASKMDLTGKWISEVDTMPKATARLFRMQYMALLQVRCPMYSEHDAPFEISAITRWCRLILPFRHEDGFIDRILVGNVPVTRRR